MTGEARTMWERFITAPENAALLKRYAKSAKEPAPLFDSIGEDLGSSSEEVRKTAFWALVTAMPELTNVLHERETRAPGWRDGNGKDQQVVNRGLDILSYLHRVLVTEHRFKTCNGYEKDPRPYMNRASRNWKIDAERKRRNSDGTLIEVPIDHEAALNIPDPAASPEDRLIIEEEIEREEVAFEERKRELRAWGFFRSDDEQDLCMTVHVDESPIIEVQKRLGIRYENTARQRLSRCNKTIVAGRDAVFTFLLLTGNEFSKRGKIPRFPQDTERSEEWIKRVKRSVQPGAWMWGETTDGNELVYLRPLTTSLRGAPAHIYLAAIQNDYGNREQALFWHPIGTRIWGPKRDPDAPDFIGKRYTLLIDAMINPKSRASVKRALNRNTVRWLRRFSQKTGEIMQNEIPGLNDALVGVPDDYDAWLISNSLPVKSYFS